MSQTMGNVQHDIPITCGDMSINKQVSVQRKVLVAINTCRLNHINAIHDIRNQYIIYSSYRSNLHYFVRFVGGYYEVLKIS
jgi:hypothetical protein